MPETHLSAAAKFLAVLQDVAESNSFINYEIKFDSKRSSVDGYVGNITEAQIVSKNKELNLVIKSCEFNDKIRAALPIESIFEREIYVYETIIPVFRNFEIEHGLKPSEFAPTFYKSYNNNDCNALILDNLKTMGYSVHNQKDLLDSHHMQLVMKQYAKFHAISLAYKDQHLLKFETLVSSMEDFTLEIFTKSEYLELMTKQLKKTATSLDSELYQEVKNVYDRYISESASFLAELPSMVDEFSVILHGDCWKNNMLFKYGEESDPTTPTDVRLIDFQISRLASPMVDIANFFYACSSKEVMDNMQKYLNIYYDSLSHHLLSLGSDPKKIYPFSIMMKHWKKLARYGLLIRASVLSVMFSEVKERKNISDILESGGNISDMLDYKISDIEKYNDLSRHTITHFVENQLI